MDSYNMILENALMEVFEKHSGEIIGKLDIKLNCEDLKDAIHEEALDLLREILYYIDHSNDRDYFKIETIRKMLVENGVQYNKIH